MENKFRNIAENISVTRKETITRTDKSERLKGYFCSDVLFNLSHKVLTDFEINFSGKGLGFSPTPTFIKEANLKSDFADFARKIRCKSFLCNKPTEDFSEILTFRVKSTWSPP